MNIVISNPTAPIYFKLKNSISIRLYKFESNKFLYWNITAGKWSSSNTIIKSLEKLMVSDFIKEKCNQVPELKAAEIEPTAFGLKNFKMPEDNE